MRKRDLFYVFRPGDEEDGGFEDDSATVFWDFVIEEHPVCLRHQQGNSGALKVSDFLTLGELHRTRLYDLWFRPWEVEHELSVTIPSPLWHTKTFLFDRGVGRDFTERDRLVLDRLQPHSDPSLADGEDAPSPLGGARRPRARLGRGFAWRDPLQPRGRDRVRLGTGAAAAARVLSRPARRTPSTCPRRMDRIGRDRGRSYAVATIGGSRSSARPMLSSWRRRSPTS